MPLDDAVAACHNAVAVISRGPACGLGRNAKSKRSVHAIAHETGVNDAIRGQAAALLLVLLAGCDAQPVCDR